jgi:hypothetical protein
MQVELRRFPRIQYSEPVTVEVEKASEEAPGTGQKAPTQVSATFRDISCQGAEVTLGPESKHLIPGTTVTLKFRLEEQDLAIPARVVWTASSKAGLRLHMRDVSDDIRKAYAGWIVPLTNKAIAEAKAAAS